MASDGVALSGSFALVLLELDTQPDNKILEFRLNPKP
jgi:hypothetical protein